MRSQTLDIRGFRLLLCGVVRHQTLLARLVLAGEHHRFLNLPLARELRFDLPELDPVPADLHLRIVTT